MDPHAAILIVEDDPGIRQALAEGLNANGYLTVVAPTAEEALTKLGVVTVDLALVDLKLPRMGGTALLQELRRREPNLVLVVMTANPSVESAITALHLEAYDYLLKPFTIEKVLEVVQGGIARRRQRTTRESLLRQLERTLAGLQSLPFQETGIPAPSPAPSRTDGPGSLVVGRLEIDLLRHVARVDQQEVDLTPTEFNLLATLLDRAPAVVSAQELLRQATGYQADPAEARELVKWHIHHLRSKVERDPKKPQQIVTVRGRGYRVQS